MYKVAGSYCNGLDLPAEVRSKILLAAPKVLQAVFAACTDLFTYLLAGKMYGPRSPEATAALMLTILSPWQWFCSGRTFSNSLETTLTVAALVLWPWDWFLHRVDSKKRDDDAVGGSQKHDLPLSLYPSLVLAAFACILRPTNLIIWVALTGTLAWNRFVQPAVIPKLLVSAAITGSVVLTFSIAADRAFYGELVLPPLKFLQFNVGQGLAGFYGVNRLAYYFTEGVGLLLISALPFALLELYYGLQLRGDRQPGTPRVRSLRTILAYTVLIDILALSLISHKEVRFIYPLLPILHVLAARPAAAFFHPTAIQAQKYRGMLFTLGFALNLIVAQYSTGRHQRGVIDVMHYLRKEYEVRYQLPGPNHGNMTVGFLMPCHSTPWISHFIHPEINAWALTCEPPLGLSAEQRREYLDEADVFYADPAKWMQTNMADVGRRGAAVGRSSKRAWPQYVAFFQQLEPTMKTVLQGSEYEECWRGFNTHWHDDWRRKGDVVVWCRGRQW